MVTQFNKGDLVDFGNQLIHDINKKDRIDPSKASRVDVENWLEIKDRQRDNSTIRAKLKCVKVDECESNVAGENINVYFETHYEEGNDENSDFAKYTPAANMTICIDKECAAFNHFQIGEFYYFDINKVKK